MSPAVMRMIFGGFVAVMAGVVVNTLMLQPEVSPALASQSLAKARPQTAAAAATKEAITQDTTGTRQARRVTVAEAVLAPAPVIARSGHLTTDSAQPARMPSIPEVEGDPNVILEVQRELLKRGYGPVVTNGIIGPLSRAAIMAYEFDNDLPLTGEATETLLGRMREGPAAASALARLPSADARKVRSVEAEQVVRTVQHSLTTLGYEPGRIDGRVGEETERAIRAFEVAQGLQGTGRVSAEVFSLLARAMGARSARVAP